MGVQPTLIIMRFSGSVITLSILGTVTMAQQLSIPRIDLMPNMPSPYQMRDWKRVVRAYDSLAFQESLAGESLPLVTVIPNGVNYPSNPAFLLRSYVGTAHTTTSEAVNALPALVGATLAGHDMSSFFDRDWVTMSRDWFNNRPSEFVYLNGPSTMSGDDWWYETMPNVFFYQLSTLYPRSIEVTRQFTLVADQWLRALRAMGGSVAPWRLPGISHRAWKLSTMTANDAGVVEPEGAGAIAWIQYCAYVATGETGYRVGAEWAMEALNAQSSNPAYELQLSYGVQTAARMNAELGTRYDISKLLGWCFDVGALRSWGSVVGIWGGLDCSGLIGEVNGSNDYAFAMNTFQQVAALAPVARYDERFARAIGKWVLNAANASRLFYAGFLPDSLQDSETWARVYDPQSVVAYEALRQSVAGSGPYGTGDAIAGGWASTNLSLYSSSSVGYLAAVVETTDVPGVLALDLLRTDFFRPDAFPTMLVYNPYVDARSVTIAAEDGVTDVYDLVSNSILATGISGSISIVVPGDAAVVAALLPAGTQLTHEQGRLMAGGIVVDYNSGVPAANRAPRVKAMGALRDTVARSQTIEVFCAAEDPDEDMLTFAWFATSGPIISDQGSAVWQAPDSDGTVIIRCRVSDGNGGTVEDSLIITVLDRINNAPVIGSISADARRLSPGGNTNLLCEATDPDGDSLTYDWTSSTGSIQGAGATAAWTAPGVPANAIVRCVVTDALGASVTDSISIMVRNSVSTSGSLLAFYPFDGNVEDASGFNRNGTASGVTPTVDRLGRPSRALAFDGVSDIVRVAADSGLNCRSAITVAFWMNVSAFPPREQYPVSHGNWTNRWKVSVSNQRIRWTVKTTSGVKDLDSESLVVAGNWIHVAVRYDGADMETYLNGTLDAFTPWTGDLLTTSIDLTIGQALPTELTWGFLGALDEVRVYDYALDPQSIAALPLTTTKVEGDHGNESSEVALIANAPNPFNPSTVVSFELPASDDIRLTIVDILGRTVAVLSEGEMLKGRHTIRWDASGHSGGAYVLRLRTSRGFTHHKILYLR